MLIRTCTSCAAVTVLLLAAVAPPTLPDLFLSHPPPPQFPSYFTYCACLYDIAADVHDVIGIVRRQPAVLKSKPVVDDICCSSWWWNIVAFCCPLLCVMLRDVDGAAATIKDDEDGGKDEWIMVLFDVVCCLHVVAMKDVEAPIVAVRVNGVSMIVVASSRWDRQVGIWNIEILKLEKGRMFVKFILNNHKGKLKTFELNLKIICKVRLFQIHNTHMHS